MLKTIDSLLEKMSLTLEEPTKEEVHEWKSHPVTKAWFAECIRLYSDNVTLLTEHIAIDDAAQLQRAQCVGENNILEQFLEFDGANDD